MLRNNKSHILHSMSFMGVDGVGSEYISLDFDLSAATRGTLQIAKQLGWGKHSGLCPVNHSFFPPSC